MDGRKLSHETLEQMRIRAVQQVEAGMSPETVVAEFKVHLSEVSVGRLLRGLGLSPQKPLYRAYQRDEEKVKAWKETAYPELRKLAKKEGARVYFGDEASVRSDHHSGTTWAPMGETPQVETSGARFSVQMISAISAQGQMRFMTFTGTMNADTFIDFLKRLIYKADQPIFLILDGHPVSSCHQSWKMWSISPLRSHWFRRFIA